MNKWVKGVSQKSNRLSSHANQQNVKNVLTFVAIFVDFGLSGTSDRPHTHRTDPSGGLPYPGKCLTNCSPRISSYS